MQGEPVQHVPEEHLVALFGVVVGRWGRGRGGGEQFLHRQEQFVPGGGRGVHQRGAAQLGGDPGRFRTPRVPGRNDHGNAMEPFVGGRAQQAAEGPAFQGGGGEARHHQVGNRDHGRERLFQVAAGVHGVSRAGQKVAQPV